MPAGHILPPFGYTFRLTGQITFELKKAKVFALASDIQTFYFNQPEHLANSLPSSPSIGLAFESVVFSSNRPKSKY